MSSNLLTLTEKISNNLSTKQIINTLNALLNAAAEPLFNNCGYMRELIFQAMLQTQIDHRRKISIHDKETTAALMLYAIVNHDFNALKLCELDRSMIFKATNIVADKLSYSIEIENKLLRNPKSVKWRLAQHKLAKQLGIANNIMANLSRWITPYIKLYMEFKKDIMAKYIKFAYQESRKAQFVSGLFVDGSELFKNYLLAVDKALDKCDANQGTLTSYIANWMMSARSSPDFDHQYGVAFSIPANIRKDRERAGQKLDNMSQSISDKHYEIIDDVMDDTMYKLVNNDTVLLSCLRHVKNNKIPYLILDIPIVLNQREIANLKGNMK